MGNEMTRAQEKVYNAIKTNGWFLPDEVMLFKNYRSHLQKLEQKGYLEVKLIPKPNDPNPHSYILKYKKTKIKVG